MRTAESAAVDGRVERSRAAVLEAAAAILVESGVARVTIEGVSERSGVAKTTIYRHWRSRSQLVFDAFESLFRAGQPALPAGPVRERLIRVLAGLIRALAEARWASAVTGLIDAADRDPELRGLVQQFIEERMNVLRMAIAEAIATGELRGDVGIDLAASMIAGPVFYRRLVSRETLDPAFAASLVDAFLNGARECPPEERV